jgi:hypothetical protein
MRHLRQDTRCVLSGQLGANGLPLLMLLLGISLQARRQAWVLAALSQPWMSHACTWSLCSIVTTVSAPHLLRGLEVRQPGELCSSCVVNKWEVGQEVLVSFLPCCLLSAADKYSGQSDSHGHLWAVSKPPGKHLGLSTFQVNYPQLG